MSQILLALLVPVIHLGTLMVPAGTSSAGLVSRFCCPGAQAYWLWELWPATGTLSHPLTLLFAAWLALLGTRVVPRIMLVG